ncbi:MAG: NAD(P)H-dependent oxidoreductase subunit E, partial [Firmicutes bacterium]|nr:NAD(P)H-dependent oxidoreductase subunit E [Bacillota bacterium]
MTRVNEACYTLLVCTGTGCLAGGADRLLAGLEEEVRPLGRGGRLRVKQTGCHGLCQQGPSIIVEPGGFFCARVAPGDVPEIVAALASGTGPPERLLFRHDGSGAAVSWSEIPFFSRQERALLSRCGLVDPENINEYLATDGYRALAAVLDRGDREEVIAEIKRSGLRGLGGAGLPAGRKWEACYRAPGAEKFVICNGDEGDPGAFQDRAVMESDPFAILEGMTIAGYAVGASKGYIYVRAEYPLAVKRLQLAIEQARQRGFLGRHILDRDFSFDIEVFQGAGAFVCGESTALVSSIEGNRGFPRPLPRPRTTESGLWGRPTLLNNVKTFAYVPRIILHGAAWFATRGTEKSKGTAVFSLTGKVANCGLIEVPMGTT